MKKCIWFLIHAGFWGQIQAADVPLTASSTGEPPRLAGEAERIKDANRERDLPLLVAPGVRGLDWGMPLDKVQPSAITRTNVALTTNDVFVREFHFDETTKCLNEVLYRAKRISTNHKEWLDAFERVRSMLFLTYGAPSTILDDKRKAAEATADTAPRQNKAARIYYARWNGPETSMALDLRGDEMTIRFFPSSRTQDPALGSTASGSNPP